MCYLKGFIEILGMGEWAPPFFGASSATPSPPFLAESVQADGAGWWENPVFAGVCRLSACGCCA